MKFKKTTTKYLAIHVLLVLLLAVLSFEIYLQSHQGEIGDDGSVITSFNPDTKDVITNQYVELNVPFVSQAPLGKWWDPRQETGCEVTSALMASLWIKNQTITPQEAEKVIINAANFELRRYGGYFNFDHDDAVKLMQDYYGYPKVAAQAANSLDDIKNELRQGRVVLLPLLGRRLNNPFYKPPGPATHMIVVRGFDESTQEFITNDPGTKNGENYRYGYAVIQNAMVDFPGNHRSTKGKPKTMVVVER